MSESVRFFLIIMAWISPIFVVRILWPRLPRRWHPLYLGLLSVTVILFAWLAVWCLLAFLIAAPGLANGCPAWACEGARALEANRWRYLAGAALAALTAYGIDRACRRLIKHLDHQRYH